MMGTRSLTVFKYTNEKEIVVMYRQFDGYPEGHGLELADFLDGIKMVNGIPGWSESSRLANGMGCLAAQTISQFKDGVGGIYLYPAGTRDCWEDFIYTVTGKEGESPLMTVTDSRGKTLFNGSPSDFKDWLKEND